METKKLLIGTRSKGKFPEIVDLLKTLPFEFLSLNDIPQIPKEYETKETEETFEGNAILKAKDYGKHSGLLCAAEDSGLEVDALGGRPGVLSARWAPGSDEDRYMRLLEELDGVPEAERTARFKAVVAIYDPKSNKVQTTSGVCTGKIALLPKGTNGFGYDPIFFVPQFGKTSAELTMEEKNSISHRAVAWKHALKLLDQML